MGVRSATPFGPVTPKGVVDSPSGPLSLIDNGMNIPASEEFVWAAVAAQPEQKVCFGDEPQAEGIPPSEMPWLLPTRVGRQDISKILGP